MVPNAFFLILSFWGIKISITNTLPQLPTLFKTSFETYTLTQQIIDLNNENEEYQDQTEQLQTNRIIHSKCIQLEDHCSDLESQLKQSRDIEVNDKNGDLNIAIKMNARRMIFVFQFQGNMIKIQYTNHSTMAAT